ncbi:MAG: hypothetical protein Q8P77_02240 [Candidatus Veblenbacteria bacterium]|nr:hypothetical protein [Candidatus Veblenbacteria bacterium]
MKKSPKKIGIFLLDLLLSLSPIAVVIVIGSLFAGGYSNLNRPEHIYIEIYGVIIIFVMWVATTYLIKNLRGSWIYSMGVLLINWVFVGLGAAIEHYILNGRYSSDGTITMLMLLIPGLIILGAGWNRVKNWTYRTKY